MSNPVGRPSLYKPKYCQSVKDNMGAGYSLTACAGFIGVSKECIYEWMRVHPEFSDAVKAAKPRRLAFLESRIMNAEASHQVTAAIFQLKNADPEEWREKQHVESSGDLHLHIGLPTTGTPGDSVEG